MSKAFTFRGRVTTVGRGGRYVSIYVYAEHGGRELAKHIGREVEGLVVIRDESV